MAFTFDITDKTIDFVARTIEKMPGNPGQESLVKRMIEEADGRVTVTVDVSELGVDISVDGYLRWDSNHPEAIEIIIDTAEQNTELFIDQAGIPGPWNLEDAVATGNWRVVGYDQGYI